MRQDMHSFNPAERQWLGLCGGGEGLVGEKQVHSDDDRVVGGVPQYRHVTVILSTWVRQ